MRGRSRRSPDLESAEDWPLDFVGLFIAGVVFLRRYRRGSSSLIGRRNWKKRKRSDEQMGLQGGVNNVSIRIFGVWKCIHTNAFAAVLR